MISFDEAIALTLGLARPLGAETIDLEAAAGRVLAAPVTAVSDSPRADVSAMDGYAVRGADLEAGADRFQLIGVSYPGAGFDGAVGPGQTVRIFTGAPVPSGADRVVIQEVVRRQGDLAILQDPKPGGPNTRIRGSDFRAGDVLLPAGRRLDAVGMVAAGAADRAQVSVYGIPRVSVLGTGDELHAPGTAHLTPFGVSESVSLGVATLAGAWGGLAVGRRRVSDDLDLLRQAAGQALAEAEVVVVTGGASVGERDFAKTMFEHHGLELVFSKVEMKPGKPVWLGRASGRLVIGLPGNPTSALVTGRLFLAPLLRGLSGLPAEEALGWRSAPLAAALPATGDRETFYRGRRGEHGLEPFADQDSGAQKTLAQADVLIRRRSNTPAVAAGEMVDTLDY